MWGYYALSGVVVHVKRRREGERMFVAWSGMIDQRKRRRRRSGMRKKERKEVNTKKEGWVMFEICTLQA